MNWLTDCKQKGNHVGVLKLAQGSKGKPFLLGWEQAVRAAHLLVDL